MYKYLFYCTELYCLPVFRPIQKIIQARRGQAAWFFDRKKAGADHLNPAERLLESVSAVCQYNPDAVFSPVNLVPDFFPGVKVQVFHGLATDLTGKKGHYRIRGFYDLYCTRAEEETHIFKEMGRRHPHFEVVETGWPKVDPLFSEDENNHVRNTLNTSKPVVFYASTFSPSLTSSPFLVDTVKKLSQTGKYHWIVTLHPKTDEKVMAGYRALQGPHLTFYESSQDVIPLIRAGDVMLCDTSSIALEFMLTGKPVVTFRTKIPAPHVLNVTETSALESAIDKAITMPEDLMKEIRDFTDRIHPFRDGRSSERVLDATNQMIENGIRHLSPKPVNFWRKIRIRKKLKYYHVR
ncbi:MAG: CDP-glycerol--glycerophosphate glycerophosphotransferase [Desulfobacteraceae bacterium]|nr:CDP-glycerol glycerophosphotransferase family protein [Desulfobacteraceae bacterium]MBC2754881.1 CDP-glycerol--glycerophosphate glycerophosphotransferase [Desulfobacteraceae bacterium]